MATGTEARGLYVYGVTLAGVACDAGTVDVGRLRAVIGEEPLERYEPAVIEAAVREPGWLEERLRAHEAVLEAVHAAGPVAPFRFGTIFRSEPELRAALARAEERLAARLEELRGASECGVKAWADDAALRRWLERHDEDARLARSELDAAAEGGRRYLLEKKLRRRTEVQAGELAFDRAREAHAALAASAREAKIERPSGLDEQADRRPVLRGSYLVAAEQLAPFEQVLAELQGRDEDVGLDYALSGPWPPYSFVEVELA